MAREPLDALAPEFVTFMEKDVPWFRPNMRELAAAMGWRWLIVIPLLAVLALIPLSYFFPWLLHTAVLNLEVKLFILAIGGIITTVLYVAKNTVASRRDLFCIHCGYTIDGLGDEGTCPECGRAFHVSVIREFKKDPHFFQARWRALKHAPRYQPFESGTGPTPRDGAS
jgi:hypothetical protein